MPCKDGRRCRRKICFFAHFPRQLRILASHKDDETNYSQSCYGFCSANDNSAAASGFSPTSTLMSFSPPISPSAGEMHYDSKQMNFGLINRYIGNNTGRVIDYDVVCEELMNSLDAMELSASPATSPAAAAPTDARGEWAVKGGNSSSSMCWPDLDWVNELLM